MKRKRKRSRRELPEEPRVQPRRHNPFLFSRAVAEAPTQTSQNDGSQRDVLQHVLAFVDATGRPLVGGKAMESEGTSGGSNKTLFDTVNLLIDYLGERNETQACSALISKLDVANMLLPWATKHLLHLSAQTDSFTESTNDSSMMVLYWNTVLSCLEQTRSVPNETDKSGANTSLDGSRAGEVASILTQSALNKLVPFAAHLVLSSNHDTDIKEMREVCAKCHELFTDLLYRPTMDLACNSLLISVKEELVHTVNKECATCIVLSTKEHAQVVHSTLCLVRKLQRQGVASPKKTFLLLSSPQVLIAMSQLYSALASYHECDIDLKRNQDLVQEILWEGLFDPTNHIDGFYSMKIPPPVVDGGAEEDSAKVGEKVHVPESKQLRCYQENLMISMHTMIHASDESPKNAKKEVTYEITIAAARLAPLLLEGFIVQTAMWERNRRDSRSSLSHRAKRIAGDDISALHFRFWSNAIARPTISCLLDGVGKDAKERASMNVVMLTSLRKCLSLSLEHDTYLPSYEDKDSRHFLFLEWLVTNVQGFGEQEIDKVEETNEILCILQILISLNHLLVHDRLSHVIAFSIQCMARLETVEGSQMFRDVSELFRTMVETYSKLRQIEHFLRSFLTTVGILMKESKRLSNMSAHPLVLLNMVVHEHVLSNELASSIQHCPHGQIRPLFDALNAWIGKEVKPQLTIAGEEAVSVVANLFVLITRNVHVDKHTAADVARLCQESLKVSALPLVMEHQGAKETKPLSSVVIMKHGLILCGWLIDLQTRCDFWLGRYDGIGNIPRLSKDFDPFKSISLVLHNAMESLGVRDGMDSAPGKLEWKESSIYYPVLGELQFLACYRTQQLYSQIHEQHRVETSAQGLVEESSDMLTEAKRMVSFAVRIATHTHRQKGQDGTTIVFAGELGPRHSRWAVMVQTIAAWAPFSETTHIESFLKWFFFTLGAADSEATKVPIRVLPSSEVVEHDVLIQDRAIALSLLRDASFFEVDEIAALIRKTGLMCVAELVQDAVMCETQRSECSVSFEGLDLISHPSSVSWSPLRPEELAKISNTPLNGSLFDIETVQIDGLIRGLRILMILNGLPESVSEACIGHMMELDTIFRLEILMRLLLSHCSSVHWELRDTIIQLICACRHAATRELRAERSDTMWAALSDEECLKSLLVGLYRSTMVMVKDPCPLGDGLTRRLLSATGKFIDAMFSRCLSVYTTDRGPVLKFISSFEHLLASSSKEDDGVRRRVLVNLVRPVIKRMVLVREHRKPQNKDSGNGDFISIIVGRVVKCLHHNLWKHVQDTAVNVLLSQEKGGAKAESLLLLGDVIRIIVADDDRCGIEMEQIQDIYVTIGNVCKTVATVLLETEATEATVGIRRAAIYFLACVLTGDSNVFGYVGSAEFAKSMVEVAQSHFSSSRGRSDPLLDAVFAETVKTLENDMLKDLLNQLLHIPPKSSDGIASSVHLFTILLESLKGHEQRNEVSSYSREFLYLSLELLSPSSGLGKVPWKASVGVATRSINALMENKDVATLKERDISLILSSLSSAVGAVKHQEATRLDSSVYSACCTLVASLLQRFPKQIYACAPSLTCVMHSLLLHVLSDSHPDPERVGHAQQFARLCELLACHRDIFKKHVLGLILEFVHALQGDLLGPTLKKALQPAVFHLLDMLTQYETKQLNALMDATGKALFRSVFQSYQKLHMYKGQY